MTNNRGVLRAWLLAAALSMGTITTTNAMSVPAHTIFARDDTCGDKTYTKCPQAGFPDNFCCSPGTSCLPLAGDTTILCCPEGDDCGTIASIVCDVQLQDATANPQAVVKTTALTSQLPKCGSNCCPFGYSCDSDQNCVKDSDQSVKPEGAAGASSTTTTPTTTPSSTSKPTTSAAPVPTASADSSSGGASTAPSAPSTSSADPAGNPAAEHAQGANTSAIVGGVVGGVVFLVAVAIGVIYLVFRHRKEQERKRASNQSFVSKGAIGIISSPILQPGFTIGRSDFVAAKSNPSAHSTPSQGQEEGFPGNNNSNNARDSYSSSYDERSGTHFDERSYHPSAIVDSLMMERAADDARRQQQHQQEHDAFETIDITFDDSVRVPPFTVGHNAQRDTTMTEWPGVRPGTGGRR